MVGRVIKPHGLQGEVSVKVYSDNPARFTAGSELLIGGDLEEAQLVKVSRVRTQTVGLLVTFEGHSSREQVESLRGQLLFVAGQDLPELDEDAYWGPELVGSKVVDVDGRDLGTVTEILERAEQDLFVVETPEGDVLLPAAKDLIRTIDSKSKVIVAEPPAGLFPEGPEPHDEP